MLENHREQAHGVEDRYGVQVATAVDGNGDQVQRGPGKSQQRACTMYRREYAISRSQGPGV